MRYEKECGWVEESEFNHIVDDIWNTVGNTAELKEARLEEEMKIAAELKEKQLQEELEHQRVEKKVNDLLSRRKVGIALKRFVKRELVHSHPMIKGHTSHVLRLESLSNGKRFNAVINYCPITFEDGVYEKNHWPYGVIVDRKVPWSVVLHHMEGFSWLDLKRRILQDYRIVEFYPI